MSGLPSEALNKLVAAATNSKIISPDITAKPCIYSIPSIGNIRIYNWTVTPDNSVSGRPEGEQKCQIIIPGTARGSRQILTMDATPTVILGYSPMYAVYALWESRYHKDSGYSKNLQISQSILEEASTEGWAVDLPRRVELGNEVRQAARPNHLSLLIKLTLKADKMKLTGEERFNFMVDNSPSGSSITNSTIIPLADKPQLIQQERARRRLTINALKRDSSFSRIILGVFKSKCAVCETQLNILDAAHIIPVHDPTSKDEAWNGLALCKNHHRLYDNRLLLISSELIVYTNKPSMEWITAQALAGGASSLLDPYDSKHLSNPPSFYPHDTSLSSHFKNALEYIYRQSYPGL